MHVRIGAVTQSLSSMSDAKKYFDEAYHKHPNYVEGLIVYAMVSGQTCALDFVHGLHVDIYEAMLMVKCGWHPDGWHFIVSGHILIAAKHIDGQLWMMTCDTSTHCPVDCSWQEQVCTMFGLSLDS